MKIKENSMKLIKGIIKLDLVKKMAKTIQIIFNEVQV